MIRAYHVDGTEPDAEQVWVFGSNLAGINGAGAARLASRKYGAKWGVAEGATGRSYAIPTKTKTIRASLSVEAIEAGVRRFLAYAEEHSDVRFFVTRVGCGLAGYSDADIAPLFKDAPPNCSLPEPWRDYCNPG